MVVIGNWLLVIGNWLLVIGSLVNLVNMVIWLLFAPGRKASEHTLGVNSGSKKTLPL